MTNLETDRHRTVNADHAHGGNAVYGLGLVGALVYYWQQADSFGGHLAGILKAVVWPGFLIYHALRAVHG